MPPVVSSKSEPISSVGTRVASRNEARRLRVTRMKNMLRTFTCAVVTVVSIAVNVHTAHAQGFVAPSLGVTLANASGEGRADFGAAFGWVAPREPIGVELDVVYAPSFFGGSGTYGANSVTTVMGNVIIAGGTGGRYGFGRRRAMSVRPYASGGVGVMHEVVTTAIPGERVANNDLGLNLGAGVMALPRRSIGLRGDVRYFRNLVNDPSASVDFGAFHFWRASIGLVLGF
jgi:outer membrane protein with beta-barrel domain